MNKSYAICGNYIIIRHMKEKETSASINGPPLSRKQSCDGRQEPRWAEFIDIRLNWIKENTTVSTNTCSLPFTFIHSQICTLSALFWQCQLWPSSKTSVIVWQVDIKLTAIEQQRTIRKIYKNCMWIFWWIFVKRGYGQVSSIRAVRGLTDFPSHLVRIVKKPSLQLLTAWRQRDSDMRVLEMRYLCL